MPTATAVPVALNSNSGWSLGGGATDAVDAVDTGGDSKYLSAGNGSISVSFNTANLTVPSGAVCYSISVSRGGEKVGGGTSRLFTLTGTYQGVPVSGAANGGSAGYSIGGLSIPAGAAAATIVVSAPADATSGLLLDSLSFTIVYNRPPNAPINLSPAEGSYTQGLTPTFTGTRSDPDNDLMNAVDIEVRKVSNDALKWASGWLTVSPAASTFSKAYGGSALDADSQYKYRVRTRDNTGAPNAEGAWSGWVTFTANVNDAPTATQNSPAADAQPGTTTPDFTFSFSDPDVGDVFTKYQLGVRRKSDSVVFWLSAQQDTTAGQKTARQATVAFNFDGGATPLVSGTEYQWRVRVQDAFGAWSAYTGWRDFTPSLRPNAPLLTSPAAAPTVTNTLTPTISGTYQQGSGGTEAGYQYEVRSGVTTIYASGDVAGAFGTGQAYGTDNPADTPASPPALAWGQTYTIRARSKDNLGAYSDWTTWRTFQTNAPPLSPSAISPGNGQVVNDVTPDLSWQHNDPDGDAQTAVDIELYDVTAGAFVSGYNPKSLSQATQAHTVTGVALVEPHAYQLRVRTTGLAGAGAGAWSAPVQWTVANAPSVAVTAPTSGEAVTASSLLVEWTFTGGSGVQATYRVRLFAADAVTVLHDSGVVVSAADSYLIPAGAIRNGGAYFVQVLVEDTLGLDGASGQVPFTAEFVPPASITGLAAVAIGGRA